MSNTDLQSNIVLGADVSGVESGMARGKRAVEDFGNVTERTGRRASEGLAGIGRGGDNAARTVERATRSLEQQIQRQIVSMQAGSRESREYWEAVANQRGVNSQALRPLLDQLDVARAKTAEAALATTNWRTEITKVGPVLASVFAAVSFTAFAAKLISVQREIDVLNSSLVTVTGSSKAAEQELAWLKDFASETPFGLAQATEGFIKMKSLGLDPTRAALTSFGNTSAAMGKSLNQMIEAVADASTGEFERLKEFGIKAKQEGAQVSLTFQGVTTTIGNNAKEITKYLQAIGDTQFAGAMETRAKTLDGAISELGDTWDELFRTINTNNTGSLIYDSVLLASGAVRDLTTILGALNAASDQNAASTDAMKTVQEGFAVVLETVAVVGVTVASTLTGVGREVGALAAQVVALATLDISGFNAIGQAVKEDAVAARKEWEATVDRILNARTAAANRPAAKEPDRPTPPPPRPAAEDAASKAAANAYKTFIESIKEKIALEQAELASGAKLTESQRLRVKVEQDLTGARKANALQLVEQLASIERIQKTAQTEATEAGEAAKAYADLIEARQNSIASLANQAQREREAAAAIGLTRIEVAGLEVAKLEEAAADKERRASMLESTVADKEAAKLYRDEAKALRDLAAAKRGTAEKEEAEEIAKAAGDSAKKAAEDWKRYTDDINKSLTDALLRGFEDGKGFAQNLRDTTENMFKTLILRPTISAIMEPVSGTISSVLGTGSSTGGGILGAIKDGKSLYEMGSKAYSWFTGAGSASGVTSSLGAAFYTAPALYAGSAALAGTASTALAGGALGSGTVLGTGTVLGSSAGALGTGTALLGTGGTGVAIGTGTATAVGTVGTAAAGSAPATSALAGMGPYGWIAAAAILAIMAFSGKGEKRYGGQYAVNFEDDDVLNARRGTTVSAERGTIAFLEGPSGGDYAGETARKLITGTTQGINTLLKDLGSGMALTGFQAGLETSGKGRGGVFSGGTLTGGITFGESGRGDSSTSPFETTSSRSGNAEETVKNFANDMLQVTVQALQAATDLPKAIKAQLTGIDAEKLTDEAATQLLNSIQAQIDYVKSFRDTLNMLPFANLKNVAFDTAAGLIAAAGSIEALNQNITGYFENYFTQEEQRTAAVARVSSAFKALDLVMPDVSGEADAARAAFRAMAESIDVSTEAGQKQYAGILALQGAFASLTPVIDKAAEAARLAESVMQQRQQLEIQLLQMQGNTAEIRSRELAALLSEENRAIQQAIYAMQDKQTADAAAKAAQDAADRVKAAWQSVGDTLVKEIKRIRGEAATAGTEGLAYAQSAFAVATAQARAGDQEAASSLPEISRTVLELAEKTASSAVDLKIFQAQIAASLMETTKAIAASQGTTVPAFAAGGAHSGGWAMVGEQGPELAYLPPARIYTASQSAGMLGDVQGLQDEMRRMREDLRQLGDGLASLQLRNARAAEASHRLLEDVTEGGAAMRTTEVAP